VDCDGTTGWVNVANWRTTGIDDVGNQAYGLNGTLEGTLLGGGNQRCSFSA